MKEDPQAIRLELEKQVQTAVRPSPRVCEVAAMFGLGVDDTRTLQIVPRTTLTLRPGRLVFITGASGGGKSTLLRLVNEQLQDRPDVDVIDFNALGGAPDMPLVDLFENASLEDALRWLSLAGLNDAFVMLRQPNELSDGQRYRLRLARAMAQTEQHAPTNPAAPGKRWAIVLADEFGATLDRQTAKVIARNVRRWTRRSGACFIAATTHDDLLEPLQPDVLIVQHPGQHMEVLEKPEARNPNDEANAQ